MLNRYTSIASIASVTLIIIVIVSVAAFDQDASSREVLIPLVAVLVSTFPSIFAAYKADKANDAIRNGVLKTKVQEAIVEINTDATAIVGKEDDYDGR